MKYDEILEYKGNKLTDAYIASLNKEEREELIDPLTDIFYEMGYQYPDNLSQVDKEWKRILKYEPELTSNVIFNNDSRGTYICKYFCKDFYNSRTVKNKHTLVSIFDDKELVRKIIINRLGLNWYEETPGKDGTFHMSPKMIFWQAPRSMRLTNQQSIYKPVIHKYLVQKYSVPGDVVYDYSCGWGARMLGAASLGDRKYVGVDPLTIPDLERMRDYLKLQNVTLIKSGSESYRGNENSVDFAASSPPYFNQEVYSQDKTQAYNNGEDYFYNIYWKQTLQNIKFMLKPGKWFALNVKNYPKMVEMAEDVYGPVVEHIALKTGRSHLNKAQSGISTKNEYIYLFKNNK